MKFDPIAIFRVLQLHRVKFIVIGGIAAAAHGSPSITQDLDVCYAWDQKNLRKLALALRDLSATLRGAPEGAPFQIDEKTLNRGDHFTFSTVHGDFDCLGNPAGSDGYDALLAGAELMDLDDLQVEVASLDDLIRMKRASGRPKDRAELEILGALRDEIEQQGP